MKTLAMLVLAAMLAGCVGTAVRTNEWTMYRLAVGYKADAKITTDGKGAVNVDSYSGQVQTEFIQAVIEAAIAAKVK